MEIQKILTIILTATLVCGCSVFRKFSRPQTVEEIYSQSTINYTDKDNPADIISSALRQAKQNAVKQIAEVFVDETVIEQRQKDLDKYLLSEPDHFIYDYRITKEDYYSNSYTMNIKAYLKIDVIIKKLNELNLIGKKRPKKVAIYPNVTSEISFSDKVWLNQITAKLSENLYTASLLAAKTPILPNPETIFEKAQESKADYVMVIDIAVRKLVQGSQFISGFYPYKSNINLSVYSTEKSRLITKISKHAGGFETNPKNSVETSVKKAIQFVLEELTFPFEKSAALQSPIVCEVKSLKTLTKIKKFYDTLLDSDIITDFSVTQYKRGGDVTFELETENTSGQEFAALLLRQKPFELTVEEISKYKITLSAE